LKADAEALVNTVNGVGVMGRGIAAQFKRAYPKNFHAYRQACTRHEVQPGRMLIVETGRLANPRWVINFPTKRHWRGNSLIEDIAAGLAALVADIRRLGIKSIAVPPLGCGLGGLDWAAVRPRIEQVFAALPDVTVLLFEPDGAPVPDDMVRSTNAPTMTPGRAVLVGLIERYLAGLMDPFVSLLEIHKLMYFMQEAGEPLRLRYTKALYGRYAENLRQVLAHVEGHFLTGYADGGDAPDKRLELVPGASKDALTFLEGDEVQRQEREIATGLVARGVRTAAEFRFVRKMAGFRANEIAELLGVRPETVSRWERGEAEIPRSATFALGELFDRPRVRDLEELSPYRGES